MFKVPRYFGHMCNSCWTHGGNMPTSFEDCSNGKRVCCICGRGTDLMCVSATDALVTAERIADQKERELQHFRTHGPASDSEQ